MASIQPHPAHPGVTGALLAAGLYNLLGAALMLAASGRPRSPAKRTAAAISAVVAARIMASGRRSTVI